MAGEQNENQSELEPCPGMSDPSLDRSKRLRPLPGPTSCGILQRKRAAAYIVVSKPNREMVRAWQLPAFGSTRMPVRTS